MNEVTSMINSNESRPWMRISGDSPGSLPNAADYVAYKGKQEDHYRYEDHRREVEALETLSREKKSLPFLRLDSPIRNHSAPPVSVIAPPAVVAIPPSVVIGPTRPSHLVEDTIPMIEHKRIVQELLSTQDEEIRRSDIIHARHCNDLVTTVEEARSQRDAIRNQLSDLQTELERSRGDANNYNKMKLGFDSEVREKDTMSNRVTKLESDKVELLAEIDRLRFEAGKLYDFSKKQEADCKRGFQKIQRDYQILQERSSDMEARLRAATTDFRGMESDNARLSDQLGLGKNRYSLLADDCKKRDHARGEIRRHVESVAKMFSDVCARSKERSTKGTTPYKELQKDQNEFKHHLTTLEQMILSNRF